MNITRLIINTCPDFVVKGADAINTDEYTFGYCIGCTQCWLKAPGVCLLNDDWEMLFKRLIKADAVIFIAEAKLGFISYKMKNIVDRLIPIASPYIIMHNGEMRHALRYGKSPDIGLIYTGNGDKEFLTAWLERFAVNFISRSLGVYNIMEREGITHEFGDIQLLPKT